MHVKKILGDMRLIPLILTEIFFFVIFGILASPFRDGIGNNLVNLGDEIISAQPGYTVFSSQYFQHILLLAAAIAAIAYVLYSFVHGWIWKKCFEMLDIKAEHYIRRFFLINIIWFIIFALFIIVNFILSYFDLLNARYNPNGFTSLGTLSSLFLIIFFYFAVISYANLASHSVRSSLKRSVAINKKVMGILVMFAGLYLLVGLTQRINYWLFMFLGFVFIPFAMVYAKILSIEAVHV